MKDMQPCLDNSKPNLLPFQLNRMEIQYAQFQATERASCCTMSVFCPNVELSKANEGCTDIRLCEALELA